MNKREREVIKLELTKEENTIKALECQYRNALRDIDDKIRILQSDELTQSRIYQIQYQKALRGQVEGILDKLHGDQYATIQQYLHDSYQDGYIGTMYSIHGQGIPLIVPLDQDAAVKAIITDSKLSDKLYDEIGVNIKQLKQAVSSEITRGIATNMPFADIARNIANRSKAPLSRAKTIVRTESHRIQQAAANDARDAAKDRGCDVVKQWDGTLDGDTRPTHRRLDGQIRETNEPFEMDGKTAMYPGDFGKPEEDCNCRCVALTRAKWALDEDELKTLKERAEYFKLNKKDDFEDFEKKYLKAAETQNNDDSAETQNDEEFDIFGFFDENPDYGKEAAPQIEYPEELVLTEKDKRLLDGINAYYDKPDLPMSQWPKGYRVPGFEVRLALDGKLTDETADLTRKRLQAKIDEAEEMIRKRKEEGYKFDKTAAIARRELNRELSHEEGRVTLGRDGIRYWQAQRKNALDELEELEFAVKLQRRYEYTGTTTTKRR